MLSLRDLHVQQNGNNNLRLLGMEVRQDKLHGVLCPSCSTHSSGIYLFSGG